MHPSDTESSDWVSGANEKTLCNRMNLLHSVFQFSVYLAQVIFLRMFPYGSRAFPAVSFSIAKLALYDSKGIFCLASYGGLAVFKIPLPIRSVLGRVDLIRGPLKSRFLQLIQHSRPAGIRGFPCSAQGSRGRRAVWVGVQLRQIVDQVPIGPPAACACHFCLQKFHIEIPHLFR